MINFVNFVLFLIQEARNFQISRKNYSKAKKLVNNGAKEITLLGQNVNAYNYNGKKLSDLITEISKIENLKE